jgi:hypothetical protein
MTKKFIAQAGSNNTVRVYDASTGALHRIFNFDGNIVSQPIVMESEMTVTVQQGIFKTIKIYNVINGSLKKSISIQ